MKLLWKSCERTKERSPDLLQYFLDGFGNFENVVKIWTRGPPIYYPNVSKNTRKLWNHPGKILFVSIWDSPFFENFRKLVCPMYNVFVFVLRFVGDKVSTYFANNFAKMRI